MDSFLGTYKNTSTENYDEFLEALGVSWMYRKAAVAFTPQLEISKRHGLWAIKVFTITRTVVIKFKLGYEHELLTDDGRLIKTLVYFKGGKIHVFQSCDDHLAKCKCVQGVCELNGYGTELVYTRTIIKCGTTCILKFRKMDSYFF